MSRRPTNSTLESESDLKRWYDRFNLRYFGGELPDDTVIYWEPVSGCHGDCNLVDGQFVIRLNPAGRGWQELAKITLIHEMAHAKLWPYQLHGAPFLAEMDRLYGLGAFRRLL